MRDFGLIAAGIVVGFTVAVAAMMRDDEDRMTERLSERLTQSVRQAVYLAHQDAKS